MYFGAEFAGLQFRSPKDVPRNFIGLRRVVVSKRTVSTMAAKTRQEILDRWQDEAYVDAVIEEATSLGRRIRSKLAPLDPTKHQYIIEWSLEIKGDTYTYT